MPKKIRLNKAVKEFNISSSRLVEFLQSKGFEVEANPNSQLDEAAYVALENEFAQDSKQKRASDEVVISKIPEEKLVIQKEPEPVVIKAKAETLETKVLGKIDLDAKKPAPAPAPEVKEEPAPVVVEEKKPEIIKEVVVEKPAEPSEPEVIKASSGEKSELKVLDKIDLTGLTSGRKSSKPTPKKEEEKKKDIPAPEVKPVTSVRIEPAAKAVEVPVPAPTPEVAKTENPESDVIKTVYQKLGGIKILKETVDLSKFAEKPKAKKRKRIDKPAPKKPGTTTPATGTQGGNRPGGPGGNNNRGPARPGQGRRNGPVMPVELSEEDVKNQIRETLEKLTNKGGKSKGSKYRKERRSFRREQDEIQQEKDAQDTSLKVTEFITVGELASLMNVSPTEVISVCFSLGVMVTMNQRLEADTLLLVADEFGFKIEFQDADLEVDDVEEEDTEDTLVSRAPIVTVMGHVDHGKTSLLDYVRKTNVIAGESGGITQHIGAYNVQLDNGQRISFLDTPGHEAFTAMRARGAQVTDIAIIVIAADDDVMPQTKEAISHAQAAGVPMIIAINKVDKPNANPDNIRQQLSAMNILVEEWGGNVQSQEISAKLGTNVNELLEKVLLQAEILDLKANPDRNAQGVIIEASLDKGRGYVATMLVQRGTLKIGDYLLAGKNHGKIKAMLDERGKNLTEAGPSIPITILGLDGAPTAGDKFKVYNDEGEAKTIATKREQLQRELSIRTTKHTTLEELGRRIALGEFKELNIILKGDVDGSVEALSNQLQKLSTEEISVNILHSGVGPITESDVNLATASDAIIIGFNVRAGVNAKELADKEEIEIRTYSVIYAAIDEVKAAMEGMLSAEIKEQVIGNVEIREIFKISKVGTIAGCMVTSGKITRNSKIRILRDGIVKHDGELESLKRFKDDVKEVTKGYECGLNIKGYNDIEQGDILEVYEEVSIKRKLK
ncbi:translation initiation factor IF-2 [Frigoriflavimonas asaccharolytica]|uniref:Translation initiation factor IF-2 n=1 Tax=Frigoriflavimonas asaccharolytica TaxID=2735899 RepID=A0A8J8G832_9FLAO|nr:translation initiation factor IF-2 [Frigoriflavimonas asaccharolytica]NRS92691.1 translation initiation factor IF-2 [Frigoriflavimonas asaccharolytica]